jgi:hypothetical protein
MPPSKWSDTQFLDSLRFLGDEAADVCLERLPATGGPDFREVFRHMNSDGGPLPENLPTALKDFFEDTKLPLRIDGQSIDHARIERGSAVFLRHSLASALILLVKSLPSGYSAPNLTLILSLSDKLNNDPYKRLLRVLQLLLNLSGKGDFKDGGHAVITAQHLRLLHARVRQLVRERLSDYQAKYQVPSNLEDMLATIMGFSLLVIDGLNELKRPLSCEEANDFYYLWRVFAILMGIHPPGAPGSGDYVPATLDEAREFYRAYSARHFRPAAENPEGVKLAHSLLDMMNEMLPQTPLRRLGMKIVPRIYMEMLLGREGMARVGIRPVRFLFVTKWLLKLVGRLWMWFWKEADALTHGARLHENLSRIFFKRLIRIGAGGEVTFTVPRNMEELRKKD